MMKHQELAKQLVTPSKNSRLEKFGKTITFLCLALIVFVVAMILILKPTSLKMVFQMLQYKKD